MSMRVTQSMTSTRLVQNLNANMRKMAMQQDQTSTGRKINKPSDDPIGMTYGLRYRSDQTANAQYQDNVASASSWLDFNDTQLDQATQILQHVKELMVQASTETNPQSALDAINKEIDQLKNQMTDIGNSSFNGKYVFNGQITNTPPFASGVDPKTVSGDLGSIAYEIGQGITIDVNLTADQIFGQANANDNIFSIFDRLSTALSTGDFSGIKAELDPLSSRVDAIISARSENGAKTNRTELMQNRLDEMSIGLETLQSKTEDADLERLYIDSTVTQNIYQASLSVGAKIITPSLVNFLN